MNKIIKAFLLLACLQPNEAKADATQTLFNRSLGFSQQFQEVKRSVDELKEKVKEGLTELQKTQLAQLPEIFNLIESLKDKVNELDLKVDLMQENRPLDNSVLIRNEEFFKPAPRPSAQAPMNDNVSLMDPKMSDASYL